MHDLIRFTNHEKNFIAHVVKIESGDHKLFIANIIENC